MSMEIRDGFKIDEKIIHLTIHDAVTYALNIYIKI